MADQNFLLVAHGIQAEIDITPNGESRTWAVFGNGIENLAEALNEVVQQYFFFADKGYARTYVTGMAPEMCIRDSLWTAPGGTGRRRLI